MSVRIVQCPGCQAKMKVKNEVTRFECPKCKTSIVDEPVNTFSPQIPMTEVYPTAPTPGSAVWNPYQQIPTQNTQPQFEQPTYAPVTSSLAPVHPTAAKFPALQAAGPSFDPKECVEPGTSFALGLATALVIGLLVVLTFSTVGMIWVAIFIGFIIDWMNRKRALAIIHGSGIRVAPDQFPEIYACAMTLWGRMSNAVLPEIFIIEAAVMNAFAVRIGRKNVVLLTDDMIHGCLLSKDPQSLAFILGHELAHIALNHNSILRTALRQFKKLSRLDEYSADRVAMRLVGNSRATIEGIVLLTVGPQLLPYLNYSAVQKQAQEVASNKVSKKAEKRLTHPLLLHRLNRAFRFSS